jgi:hypothetical protein
VSTTSVKRSSIIMPNLVEIGPTVWKHEGQTATLFFFVIRARETAICRIYSECEQKSECQLQLKYRAVDVSESILRPKLNKSSWTQPPHRKICFRRFEIHGVTQNHSNGKITLSLRLGTRT